MDYELWRGQSPLDLVADFNLAFAPDHLTDTVIDDATVGTELALRRVEFIQEEMNELLDALATTDAVEFTDAIIDMLYFLYGTALALGIPLEESFLEVHESNMAKRNPDGSVTRHPVTGKVQKPEGWQAPNIAAVLERARERGSPFPV